MLKIKYINSLTLLIHTTMNSTQKKTQINPQSSQARCSHTLYNRIAAAFKNFHSWNVKLVPDSNIILCFVCYIDIHKQQIYIISEIRGNGNTMVIITWSSS